MALHWNPFYKSTFAEKNDPFPLRMQRALQNFSGVPTANNNICGKTHEERKNEAVLGIFDYLTFGIPAGIDKIWLILKSFILDKNDKYTGFLFGCLKGLAVLAAIPTFLASTLFNITRFLFGVVGMLVTFPITVVATLKGHEGSETKQKNKPQNTQTGLDDPYINPNDSKQMERLFENKDGAMDRSKSTENINPPNLEIKPHSWKENPFEAGNDVRFYSPPTSNKNN